MGLIARPPLDPKKFVKLQKDRLDRIYLYDEETSNETEEPRYTLTVVDRNVSASEVESCFSLRGSNGASTPCSAMAVFLIPAGRETEFIFSSRRGLVTVAESANFCARLIAVSLHRSHSYPSQESIQQELAFGISAIGQRGEFLFTHRTTPGRKQKELAAQLLAQVPFMALDGIGERNVLAQGETASPMTGPYIVEEVTANSNKVRRLYFVRNPNVIQSEVLLRMDDSGNSIVDWAHLAFDYHKHMVAGLLLLSPFSLTGAIQNAEKQTGLVIGLGGGGLLNFLQNALAHICNLTVVELDDGVVEIAKRYFGFVPTESSMVVKIGDGLTVCCSDTEVELLDNLSLEETAKSNGAPTKESIPIPSNSLSFIALDVDSKDSTVGMSCPPIPFVSIPYLERLRSILVDEGVLAINVSARDPDMLVMAKKQVSEVFTSVFECHDSDDDDNDNDNDDGEALNVVLFCKKGTSELPTETMERIEKIQQILPPLSG
eukprot:scaffold421097_cov47-Attheya_sp.AAC.1